MEREKLLNEYRLKKKREEVINKFKEKAKDLLSFKKPPTSPSTNDEKDNLLESQHDDNIEEIYLTKSEDIPSDFETVCSNSSVTDNIVTNTNYTKVEIIYIILYFILWVTVYALFVELGFGIIYLILSALFGMYFNTRTGPKKRNEISAYSVFNKNCESIDGTLKAEQLEKQLVYGVGVGGFR